MVRLVLVDAEGFSAGVAADTHLQGMRSEISKMLRAVYDGDTTGQLIYKASSSFYERRGPSRFPLPSNRAKPGAAQDDLVTGLGS